MTTLSPLLLDAEATAAQQGKTWTQPQYGLGSLVTLAEVGRNFQAQVAAINMNYSTAVVLDCTSAYFGKAIRFAPINVFESDNTSAVMV